MPPAAPPTGEHPYGGRTRAPGNGPVDPASWGQSARASYLGPVSWGGAAGCPAVPAVPGVSQPASPTLPTCSGFKNEATFQPVSAYYSVDYPGVAHIVSLGSYVPWGVDSAQYKWLVQDLASGEHPAPSCTLGPAARLPHRRSRLWRPAPRGLSSPSAWWMCQDGRWWHAAAPGHRGIATKSSPLPITPPLPRLRSGPRSHPLADCHLPRAALPQLQHPLQGEQAELLLLGRCG